MKFHKRIHPSQTYHPGIIRCMFFSLSHPIWKKSRLYKYPPGKLTKKKKHGKPSGNSFNLQPKTNPHLLRFGPQAVRQMETGGAGRPQFTWELPSKNDKMLNPIWTEKMHYKNHATFFKGAIDFVVALLATISLLPLLFFVQTFYAKSPRHSCSKTYRLQGVWECTRWPKIFWFCLHKTHNYL